MNAVDHFAISYLALEIQTCEKLQHQATTTTTTTTATVKSITQQILYTQIN